MNGLKRGIFWGCGIELLIMAIILIPCIVLAGIFYDNENIKPVISIIGLLIGNLCIYEGFRGRTHIAEHFITRKAPHLFSKIPLLRFLVNLFFALINSIVLFFILADIYIW